MLDIAAALSWSFSITSVIALVLCFVGMFAMLMDFKSRVMRLRRGDYSHLDRTKVLLKDSVQFMGFYLSNCAISFLIFWFLLGIIFTPLFLGIIYKTIWDLRYSAYALLSFGIIESISIAIAKKSIVKPNSITHRRAWSIYELYMLYITVVNTAVVAVVRVVMGFVAGMIGLFRIDRPIIP